MSEDDAAREWAERAREDLQIARLVFDQDLSRGAAYHIQQAAEKLLKAALASLGMRPPRTHDPTALLGMLPPSSRPPIDPLLARQISD